MSLHGVRDDPADERGDQGAQQACIVGRCPQQQPPRGTAVALGALQRGFDLALKILLVVHRHSAFLRQHDAKVPRPTLRIGSFTADGPSLSHRGEEFIMVRPMQLDVFFDLICPWCFMGKRRLTRALAARPVADIEIRWRPFLINLMIPRDGPELDEGFAGRFGRLSSAAEVMEMVSEAAARDGVALRLDRLPSSPSSIDAHRLVQHFGRSAAEADALIDALFSAYFTEGQDISDPEALIDTAAALGHPADEAAALLASDAEGAEVLQSAIQARRLGINAVPCFVFNGTFVLSGAQEPATLLPLLDMALMTGGAGRPTFGGRARAFRTA